jgi:hypothetical protein
MSESMIIALIGAMAGVGGSSGVWAYLQKRSDKNSATTRLLMGLAYDKIITVGMGYIHRGGMSKDEYEEYFKYLVQPYKELGGNGVADRIARDVTALPFHSVQFAEIVIKENTP